MYSVETDLRIDGTRDELAAYFDQLWGSKEARDIESITEKIKWPLHERVHRFLQERCEGASVLLEIGPGHGWDAVRFKAYISHYLGIELSGVSCRLLHGKYNIPMSRACAEDLPLLPESLDVAFLSTTLMHLHKSKALDEIYTSLKKGGFLVFIEPFGNHPLIRIYQRYKYRKLPHRYLTNDDLRSVKAKFTALEETFFGLFFVVNYRSQFLNLFFQKMDRWLLRSTFLRRFAWLYMGIYQKAK